MRKRQEQFPAFDYAKSAEARKTKKAAKEAAGLKLEWTRKKAILAKCFECGNFSIAEVKRCEIKGCALWPFRSRGSLSAAELKAWETSFMIDPVNEPTLRRLGTLEEDGEDDAGLVADLPKEEDW